MAKARKPPPKSSKITTGERMLKRIGVFVAAYLVHRNATEAALAAGYRASHARQTGHRMLALPEVQAAIARAEEEQIKRLQMTADQVLLGLAHVARFDPRKLVDEHGRLVPLRGLDDATALALAGVDVEHRTEPGRGEDDEPVMVTTKKYKAGDRLKALELLGRVHGIFEKDNKQQQPIMFDVSFGEG